MSDQSTPLRETSAHSKPLSDEEYSYVSRIRVRVGSMTPILRGEDPHYEEGVNAILEEAQENGLDPKHNYQCAVNPNSVITRQIPAWEKVKPDATDEPPTTGAPN